MALPIYTVIAPSATQANAPLTTDLAVDWTNNTEHVRQTVYNPDLHTPKIAHDHDGLNSAVVNVPHVGTATAVQYEGSGAVRRIAHPPIDKDLGWAFSNTSPEGGFINFLDVNGPNFQAKNWIGANATVLDSSTRPKAPNVLHLLGTPINVSARDYMIILLKEVEGLLAIGTFNGTGSTQAIDISSTSDNGIGDFDPDGVIIWRTNGNADVFIKTEDHASTDASNFENGAIVTDAIASLDATGFTVTTNTGTNQAGGEYRYMAWKAGIAGGMEIEKATSPQNDTAQDISLTMTRVPFLGFAVRTDATSTFGAAIITLQQPLLSGSGDQEQSMRLDSGTVGYRTDALKALSKGLVRVGTAHPNVTGETSNIWLFATTSYQVYSEFLSR